MFFQQEIVLCATFLTKATKASPCMAAKSKSLCRFVVISYHKPEIS